MRKKLLTILLSVFMAVTAFTVNVFADGLGDSPTLSAVLNTVVEGFPTESSSGWVNEKMKTAYVSHVSAEDYYLFLGEEFDILITTSLTAVDGGYQYVYSGITVKFIMESNVLTKITVSGNIDSADSNGTYTAPAPTTNVAKIGDTEYATLQEAINAVPDGTETTISILKDIKYDSFNAEGGITAAVVIPSAKNIILDLNGNKISGESSVNASAYLFHNKGNLTIKDSQEDGKLTYKSNGPDKDYNYGTSTIINRGYLTIESGTVENTTSGGASYAIDNQTLWYDDINPVSLKIEGGNMVCTTGDASIRQAAGCGTFYLKAGEIVKNDITISGGTVTGDIWIQNLLANGTASYSDLKIMGGTITGKVYTTCSDYTNMTVSISGGKIKQLDRDNATSSFMNGIVTGGLYTKKPLDGFIASGYECVDNDDDTKDNYPYKIGKIEVAKIGDKTYSTLEEAIKEVDDNETIILLKDITIEDTVVVPDDKSFSIDLNENTITTSSVTGFDIDSANLTVKNGTVISNNTSGLSGSSMEDRTKAFFLEKDGVGSLTLDGVKIESTGYSVNVNNNNNGKGAKNKTIVIKDSDLSSAKWCAVYANSVDGSNELTITNSNIHSSWTGTTMAALQICMKTTIEKTTVTNDYGAAVGCFENTDLLVKGTENSFVGANGAISTNGSKDLVQITIEGGKFKTTGTSKESGIAFYHPDGSPLTIKGGTFEGATALYVKGGTIDIQDGSFTGTGNYEAAQKVSSGAYATGDAVVIEASDYLKEQTYPHDKNPSVTITGGLFKSENGSPIAYYTFDGNNEAHNGKMVSGGVLNKKIDDAILVEGKNQVANTDPETSANYPYMIGDNTATIEVETDSKDNVVPVYQDETKNDIAIKLSRTNIDLGPEALTVAADGNIVNESLEAKAKEITGFKTGDDLTITIKTYLDMSVEKANITDTVGSEDNTFSVDITPKYVIVAKVNDGDEKVVSEGKDLSVTRIVPLKIYLPAGFANDTDRVWIKHHLKDGSSVVYGGEDGLEIKVDNTEMYVEFENPDGFSVFDVYLKKVNPDPKPTPTPKPRYIVPNTGVEGTPTNNHSLLKLSSLSILAIGTYMVIKKKKDN